MPYRLITRLPATVRKHLPTGAQRIYLEAYNSAWKQYAHRKDREAVAHKVAWTAVKQSYRKMGERWARKKAKKKAR